MALQVFGYDLARLAAGRTLYEEALALVNQQKAECGEQYEAADASLVEAAVDDVLITAN